MYTLVVRDTHDDTVVIYGRFSAESLGDQVKQVRRTSRHYYGAVVRAFAGFDDEMLFDLEVMGCYVQRVNFTPRARAAAIDNLSMLISKKRITIPANPNLIAELQVFKSEYTLDETPDYSLQSGAQSGIYALCLVTRPEPGLRSREVQRDNLLFVRSHVDLAAFMLDAQLSRKNYAGDKQHHHTKVDSRRFFSSDFEMKTIDESRPLNHYRLFGGYNCDV